MNMITGGCQCGAVRYAFPQLGRATICHCRMCQKAFGGFYGALVTAKGLLWTRDEPAFFASSDRVERGFCKNCGTPLTYSWGGDLEVSIGSLDNPEKAAPVMQLNLDDKLSFTDSLGDLPIRNFDPQSSEAKFMAGLKSNQHPDADMPHWNAISCTRSKSSNDE